MHLITLESLEASTIESIIETSIALKARPRRDEDLLRGKALYMIFEKTSTRTALAFGLGFNELGGRYFIQRWEDSNFSVGDIADETRYVARNVDIILARLRRHEDIQKMAHYSPVPVINGCCNKCHPTQAIADCMTVKELFGSYDRTLLYLGIWNNVFNSLVHSLPRLGGRLIGICPLINKSTISEEEAARVARTTSNLELYRGDINPARLRALVNAADIIYTDTWVDMEFSNNPDYKEGKEKRINAMKPFSLTSALLKDSRAVVLHPMPIHPGYEIERPVIEMHLERILDQAENRRHAAKGIFVHLLGAQGR
jgi:ornithine carbamoyltransferase